VTFHYATADLTGTAGEDYVATSGDVTIPVGSTSATVSVATIDNSLDNPDRTFAVDLTSTDATLPDSRGKATIVDDDATPSISIGDVTVQEPASGAKTVLFPVTLSGPSGGPLAVDYTTVSGTATSPGDFTATSGTLNFAAGKTADAVK